MSVIAIIPARGGSKGVAGKNLRPVDGVPLVVRAVNAALASPRIESAVVTTDDEAIAAAARSAGAEVVVRPSELAGDAATSESALLHVLESIPYLPRVIVFIQATSPFIDPADLDEAVERVLGADYDVVFSAVETYAFLWRETPAGAEGVNHDPAVRPMRQERESHYRETGAFYVMRADGFLHARHRFFGRIGVQLVDERSAIDIDTLAELEVANAVAPIVAPRPSATDVLDSVCIAAVVTDFDGVHTDDSVHVAADGTEYVTVSRSDGMGVRLLREAGYPVLILSTEENPVVAARARKLQVEVIHAVQDKAEALARWAAERGIPLDRIVYLGNDVNDLGVMRRVGMPVAVADARADVLDAASIVLTAPGGRGAVRELADLILDRPLARRGARAVVASTPASDPAIQEETWPYASEVRHSEPASRSM